MPPSMREVWSCYLRVGRMLRSAMNVDTKILAKVLACRLQLIILKRIDADQTGFMPIKCAQMNIRRLFVTLQSLHDNSGARVETSLDTKRAFDSGEWPYLFFLLERYGFGPKFLFWVWLLCTDAVACIQCQQHYFRSLFYI